MDIVRERRRDSERFAEVLECTRVGLVVLDPFLSVWFASSSGLPLLSLLGVFVFPFHFFVVARDLTRCPAIRVDSRFVFCAHAAADQPRSGV